MANSSFAIYFFYQFSLKQIIMIRYFTFLIVLLISGITTFGQNKIIYNWEVSANVLPMLFGKSPDFIQIERKLNDRISIISGIKFHYSKGSSDYIFNDAVYQIHKNYTYDTLFRQNGYYLGIKISKSYNNLNLFISPIIYYLNTYSDYFFTAGSFGMGSNCPTINNNNSFCLLVNDRENGKKEYGISNVLGTSISILKNCCLSFEMNLNFYNYIILNQAVYSGTNDQGPNPTRPPQQIFEKFSGSGVRLDPFSRLRIGVRF